MGPCDITATKRILVHSKSQSSQVKKWKRWPETPWPPSKLKTNIDDLPEFVLVEILCRLPHNKFVFRCKCVCKRWFSLISDEKFQCRFLWLQSLQNQKLEPMGSTLIFRDAQDRREFFILPELELPMFKKHDFSLRFLPCFEAPECQETDDDIYDEPIVVGTCNDLVLCCETIIFPRNYYICNPYTKQFVRLPPTPGRHRDVRVGFICDPYYYQEDDVDDKKRESNCGGIIQVNADFRYTIVRIVPELADHCFQFEFNVEIFSSETGKWTEMVVRSPHEFCLLHLNNSGGVAYNGMLYWWSAEDHFIIGLDPYYSNNGEGEGERPRFRLIDVPVRYGEFPLLSVCRGGRLRICHFFTAWVMSGDSIPIMSVWELKDDGSEEGGEWCNLTGSISLRAMVFEHPLIIQRGYHLMDSITVLAFDPNNEDILYLELFEHIMTCNIREEKLKETTLTTMYKSMGHFGRGVFPFVLPKWPTPIPRPRRRQQDDEKFLENINC